MGQEKINTFGKIGRLITRRKFSVIAVWILLLAIIVPIVATATGYTAMTLTSSTKTNTESSKASDIISEQFQTSVSNDSLLLIISTDNASSLQTQQLIDELVTKIKSDPNITGLENVTSIYTVLISTLNETNQGVYLAYDNGNLTYNLLYSVPTIYSKVWYAAFDTALQENLVPGLTQTNQAVYAVITNTNQTYNLLYSVPAAYSTVYATAYNTTRDQTLVPAINQTNQGVYSTLYNANETCNLLYGPPAMYLNYWSENYSVTDDVNQANTYAYEMTAATLQQIDPTDYPITSSILSTFYTAWQGSISSNPSNPQACAIAASATTTQAYISSISSNQTEAGFVTAVTNALTFQTYLTNTQDQDNAVLAGLAIQMVASQGSTSIEFVTAAYELGANPTTEAMTALAEDVIQNPSAFNMGTDFISQFNAAAYSQAERILSASDPADYSTYLAPLLNAFNSTWCQSFSDPSLSTYSPIQRATFVSNITNTAYINTAFASNATAQAFANAVVNNFTLTDFLTNSQAENNAKLESFAIDYVAGSAGTSTDFVNAAYNLGTSPSSSDLTTLASQIIWSPSSYGMSTNFISTFNQVSYNQTETILKNADASSYNQYTSHLLDYFNASWASLVPTSPTTSTTWINSTASEAAGIANSKFIDAYFSSNAGFADKVASTFTLQDFLNGNTTYTNAKLQDFAINYVVNESGLSENLLKAVYDLGANASKTALQTLASNIVYSPDSYNVGDALNSAIQSFVSPSQNMTIVSLSFNQTGESNVGELRSLISTYLSENPDGISSIKVTGQDAISYDFRNSTFKDLDIILPVTIVLLIVATALFFRSVITPLVTLGTIGVGLGVSMVFPYLVGTFINQVDYTIVTVLLTVLIGVGTDYSIFIIARHREERINNLPVFEAIKKSITWAGESIVTSGATVIISFLALSFTSMVFLQTMGIIIGAGVIVTLLGALTFAPALIAILGDRIFWPNSGERFQKYANGILQKNRRRGGYFARSGSFSVKHSKAIILVAVVLTVPALFIYATTVQTYNFLGSAAPSLESISGYNSLTDTFGSGRMLPSYVVVTFSEPILYGNGSFNQAELSTLNGISSYIANHEGIQKVTGPTMPYGTTVDYQTITDASDPINYSGMLQTIGSDNKSALITVELTGDPYSTTDMNYAQNIRTTLHADYNNAADVTGLYVGGTTGSILDVKNTFNQELNQILPTVAICVGLVLFFVLGSLFLPIFAVLSVFMSIFWTLGVTVLVFHSVFNYGLLFVTPLILLVLLLGLGMDYNIFILTRVREEAAKGQKLNDAIVHAIQQTGGIITAAAIILAGSLGALMLSSNMMLKELGFAFAFSILIDALVVRTYLVPAVMSIAGKWNWYNPIKRLQRIKNPEGKTST